jgi:hypothetical protein
MTQYTPNREVVRFVDFVGGNTKAAEILGCSPDQVRKLKTGMRGEKGIDPKYIRAMYYHKGFRLSFLRLYDLDWRKK